MPYIRCNWTGLTDTKGGGKFPPGQAYSFEGVRLIRPQGNGPRSCFLNVSLEREAKVGYVEAVTSARQMDIYVLKGLSSDYTHAGTFVGKQAPDHPFKYHYRFDQSQLPDTKVFLLQFKLTPHVDNVYEVHVFNFSILVGDPPGVHSRTSSMSNLAGALNASASSGTSRSRTPLAIMGPSEPSSYTSSRPALPPSSTALVPQPSTAMGPSAAQSETRMVVGNSGQMTVASQADGVVVANALHQVMGRMITVVGKKTQGYVGSTYRKTEDKIHARMRDMEEKINGFEHVVGESLEKRILNLEHVMNTLTARARYQESSSATQAVGMPT